MPHAVDATEGLESLNVQAFWKDPENLCLRGAWCTQVLSLLLLITGVLLIAHDIQIGGEICEFAALALGLPFIIFEAPGLSNYTVLQHFHGR